MTAEQLVTGIGIAVAIVAAMAGAFWWGWECRARLAEKLEYFRITNRQWHQYDDELMASSETRKRVPLRAQFHDIRDGSER